MTTNLPPDPFPQGTETPRLLIAAGPTHEPIDAVRYIGNRSSGRLGIALADRAAALGWPVTLLLGPTHLTPVSDRVQNLPFRSSADLRGLLNRTLPDCDILVMAAAVADYTPDQPDPGRKIRRSENEPLTLSLRPTPDLLAECAGLARADQLLVGFALEPADGLVASARAKLARKGADLFVANPLETMESPDIEATLITSPALADLATPNPIRQSKPEFAAWLLPILRSAWLTKLGARSKAH